MSEAPPSTNPHALSVAQDGKEPFEVMRRPPGNFDMFKDRPESAGYNKVREEVHRDADWHRSVHVWIIDRKCRQVALQLRSASKDTFPNRWDISAAGHIESGADSRETAERELAEELGIESQDLIFAFTCPAEQAVMGGCNCYEDVYFLALEKDSCKFSLGAAEVASVKWIDLEELKTRWAEGSSEYVPRVAQYRQAFFNYTNTLLE